MLVNGERAAADSLVRRPLFVATILVGSFLLFLVQPMVARMALPRLGGAPNVWNSAMVVYQLLLLAGYFYAHLLSRQPLRRQARTHLVLLALAAVTLPVGLVALPPSPPGWEVLWVPFLLLLSIGPVFFLVAAQAPLMQRWYTAAPGAGEPWALYAASNLGSFAGLIAYPLLAEPLLRLGVQSIVWSAGYALLIVLVALAARARWQAPAVPPTDLAPEVVEERLGTRRILAWLALSAVPSGLMLSTTTHLTTDIVAVPLLWVIPLGLYLLSFVVAFADRRGPARVITAIAPVTMLLAGGFAMVSRHSGNISLAVAGIALLFFVAVALHTRLYALRPSASRLTSFYLAMSAGGALGGALPAILAPVLFDWVWEHPLLVFVAALLMPLPRLWDWRRMPGLEPGMARLGAGVLLALAVLLAWSLVASSSQDDPGMPRLYLTLGLTAVGMLLVPWRWMFVSVLGLLLLAQGGLETIATSAEHARRRSYFGIYTVRDYPSVRLRTLAHGTTLHGEQSLDPAHRDEPISYYGPTSGAGILFGHARQLFGPDAHVAVVGLGTGTLACYRRPGQRWTFYEIDRTVLRLSLDRTFTFLVDCARDARIVLGDARLQLAKARPHSLDILAVDAFSSDSIPLHLITDQAFGIYLRALAPHGLLLVHVSNRYIDLKPVVAAAARHWHLAAALRDDNPPGDGVRLTGSSWIALSRDPNRLKALAKARPDAPWIALPKPAKHDWTDDYASILPYIRWRNLLGQP